MSDTQFVLEQKVVLAVPLVRATSEPPKSIMHDAIPGPNVVHAQVLGRMKAGHAVRQLLVQHAAIPFPWRYRAGGGRQHDKGDDGHEAPFDAA